MIALDRNVVTGVTLSATLHDDPAVWLGLVDLKLDLAAQAAGVSVRVLAARTALASSWTPARMADSCICA
jgi:hypothetical protein